MSDQTTDTQDEKLEQAFDEIESMQEKETTPKASGGGIGNILAIFLALIAIGIASWPAYEIYKQKQATSEVDPIPGRVAQIEAGVQRLGSELGNIEQEIAGNSAEMNARLAASEENLQSYKAGVSEAMASVQSRMGTSSQDWVYAEVEYLVRMANQRVLMERDANSALQLLQSADEIIRETDGLTAHGLREALARDIAALKATGSPDTQGIYLELSALISQVPSLSRTLPVYQAPTSEDPGGPEATGYLARFLALVRLAGNKLANLVDFRRDEVEIRRILPPEEEYFLRQNLVLKLQIAQMALLEGNQAVFESALGEAQDWVSGSFDEDNPGTVAMLDSIARLSTVLITVDLPDIGSSLKAARSQLAGFQEAQSQ